MEIHSGLPRESCGSDSSTMRALSHVAEHLPSEPYIGDFACGPGSSAIPLAIALPKAKIVAVDLHEPFIEETQKRARKAGVSPRLTAVVGNMLNPPVEPHSLEMIWCEGGLYNVGVETGLRQWRTLLKPGGHIVFNEPIWLTDEGKRPQPITDFWAAYPAMTDDAGVRAAIGAAGYQILGCFNLPESDWWDNYYTWIERKIDRIAAKYSGDLNALAPVEATRQEIEIRRRFPQHYNYRFYCIQLHLNGETE